MHRFLPVHLLYLLTSSVCAAALDDYGRNVASRADKIVQMTNAIVELENVKTMLIAFPQLAKCDEPNQPAKKSRRASRLYQEALYTRVMECRSSLADILLRTREILERAHAAVSVATSSGTFHAEQMAKAKALLADAQAIVGQLEEQLAVATSTILAEGRHYRGACELDSKDVAVQQTNLLRGETALADDDPFMVRQTLEVSSRSVHRAEVIAMACPSDSIETTKNEIKKIDKTLRDKMTVKTVGEMFSNSCAKLKASKVPGYAALCNKTDPTTEKEATLHAALVSLSPAARNNPAR